MSAGVSMVYAEEGELWLRVSPGHAVSERWLQERVPDLYAEWWAARSSAVRDQLALQVEQRLDELEAIGTWWQAAGQHQRQVVPSAVVDRVARYENFAERLGAIALDDPARAAAHLVRRAAGDALRDELAAMPASGARELLDRRLDAADLIADRPFIEAVSRLTGDTPANLHDTEQAIVEHVVGAVIVTADDAGRDVRHAHRMWERAVDRAVIREWERRARARRPSAGRGPARRTRAAARAGTARRRRRRHRAGSGAGGRVMAVSDDDGSAERLAQVRAERRHIRRPRAAERRDAALERAADGAAEWEAETVLAHDPLATPSVSAADTRSIQIAEQAALELDRAGLVADREVNGSIEIGF